eukprot:8933036-Heterocapsa_arctica.AAC.1
MGGSGPTSREERMVGLVPSTSAVKSSPIPILMALVNMSSLETIIIPLDRYCSGISPPVPASRGNGIPYSQTHRWRCYAK